MNGHRESTNEMILNVFYTYPGRWFTSAEIAKGIGISSAKGVGYKLGYLHAENPCIEQYIHVPSNKRYYRYLPEMVA